MYSKIKYFSIVTVFVLISCNEGSFVSIRDTISLSGSWKFALDTAKVGIAEKWYTRTLSDSVRLPGTLDENKKGIPNINRQGYNITQWIMEVCVGYCKGRDSRKMVHTYSFRFGEITRYTR